MSVDVLIAERTALITGAAGGIGQALVRKFTEFGYRVIGVDTLAKPPDLICWQYVQMDLGVLVSSSAGSDLPGNEALSPISELCADGLHMLVNNAAVQVLGGVEELTIPDWYRTLDINVLVPFALTKGLLPQLESVGGCVINISSIHARLTKAGFVAYATSKAALSGMTRAMAVDLGPRVRVNAIEPAAIQTPMLEAGFEGKPEEFAQLQASHPQGRIGTPEEVAALAFSVAGGELRFLHGACIALDGGISGRLHDPE